MKPIAVVLCIISVATAMVAQTNNTTTTTDQTGDDQKNHDDYKYRSQGATIGIMYCCGNHHPSHCAYGYELETMSAKFGCTGWKTEH